MNMPIERDRALAEFTDLTLLGTGRHATIYRARETSIDRWVALKILDVAEPSPAAIEAFDREATVLGVLGAHPNIVTLYRRLTLADGRAVLVLELCRGSVAEQWHAANPMPAQQAVTLGIKIAGALDTAHRGGVLHRNVTPANILITGFGEPALSDFGIATLQHGSPDSAPTLQTMTVHTAPELLEGKQTEATDVYGLGSTLYELVNGTPAFRSYAGESPAALSMRILFDPVHRIHAADVPLALTDVLLWAMERDPAGRPPSAAWLAGELARIATAEGWPRTPLLIREPRRPVSGPYRGRHGLERHRRTSASDTAASA